MSDISNSGGEARSLLLPLCRISLISSSKEVSSLAMIAGTENQKVSKSNNGCWTCTSWRKTRYHLSRVCTRGDSFPLLRALSEVWPTSTRKEQKCEDTSVTIGLESPFRTSNFEEITASVNSKLVNTGVTTSLKCTICMLRPIRRPCALREAENTMF